MYTRLLADKEFSSQPIFRSRLALLYSGNEDDDEPTAQYAHERPSQRDWKSADEPVELLQQEGELVSQWKEAMIVANPRVAQENN